MKGLQRLRIGVGDGDPPCSLKALYLRRLFESLVPKASRAASGHN